LIRTFLRIAALTCAALALHGCALQAPKYQASIDNVEQIKKAAIQPAALGSFTIQANASGGSSISLRGSPMSSSVGADYAAYLADALRQELALAGKLDPKSTLEISGVLIRNDIAAGGIVTNSGEVEARFVVRNGGSVRYDAIKRADLSWESSFIGGIAIPKAQQQYPVLVQQLLAKLLADPQFQVALR
jgi:hypothetical protein